MTKTIGKFDFECDARGAVLKTVSTKLSARCLTDGEVDEYVFWLKEDLDAIAVRMKAAIKNRPKLKRD